MREAFGQRPTVKLVLRHQGRHEYCRCASGRRRSGVVTLTPVMLAMLLPAHSSRAEDVQSSPVPAAPLLSVDSVTVPDATTIAVSFDRKVDPVSARNVFHYYVNSHAGPVPVLAASLESDARTVALTVAALEPSTTYFLNVTNVKDTKQNRIDDAYVVYFSFGQASRLYGDAVAWGPAGRLPDVSHAGYHSGEHPLPEPPIVANVRDFGATGDGVTDDTLAFQTAIAQANDGAILIPASTYILSDLLLLDKDNVVLRGEGSGENGTILQFTCNLFDAIPGGTDFEYEKGGLVWLGRPYEWPSNSADITMVLAGASAGDTSLSCTATNDIAPGDYVQLLQVDDAARSLYTHLQAGRGDVGTCSWQPSPLRWPVEIVDVIQADQVTELVLGQPLPFDVRMEWQPVIEVYDPVREAGVEHLRLRFPDVPVPDHLGDGHNGVAFRFALNCWARDLVIEGPDNGLVFMEGAKFSTASDITVLGRVPLFPAGYTGHHGLAFTRASDNVLADFFIDSRFHHDVSVEHLAHHNVIRNGRGADLNLDHHRDAPFANVFTDVELGAGTRMYASSGSTCAGSHSGARESFWNVRADPGSLFGLTPPPPWWADSSTELKVNILPARFEMMATEGPWLEGLPSITPSDLYLSQLQNRIGRLPGNYYSHIGISPGFANPSN